MHEIQQKKICSICSQQIINDEPHLSGLTRGYCLGNTKYVHSEIKYKDIHSDLCPNKCKFSFIDENDKNEYFKFLHEALEEWLQNSDGDGYFYIGNIKNLE